MPNWDRRATASLMGPLIVTRETSLLLVYDASRKGFDVAVLKVTNSMQSLGYELSSLGAI